MGSPRPCSGPGPLASTRVSPHGLILETASPLQDDQPPRLPSMAILRWFHLRPLTGNRPQLLLMLPIGAEGLYWRHLLPRLAGPWRNLLLRPEPSCSSPEAAPSTMQPSGLVSRFPLVYSRKRFQSRATLPPPHIGTPPTSPPATPLCKLNKVGKPIDALLPQPVIHKRRIKAPISGTLPRRSRRVAGAKPCSPRLVISVAQKKVMQSLGFGAQEKLDMVE